MQVNSHRKSFYLLYCNKRDKKVAVSGEAQQPGLKL